MLKPVGVAIKPVTSHPEIDMTANSPFLFKYAREPRAIEMRDISNVNSDGNASNERPKPPPGTLMTHVERETTDDR